MPNIFISHSNQDEGATLAVVDSLRRAGYDVWVDYENIRGGADWLCEIQAGIARCHAVVTILSKASAQSVWVERECLYAYQLRKPLITALVDEVLIPLHLINIQYCDLRDGSRQSLAKLLAALEAQLQPIDEPASRALAAVTSQPGEGNFFPYVEQLPAGDVAGLVARDLFHWARDLADELAFGGRANPGFHARISHRDRLVTVFSVWAYRKTPSAQLPLDYLSATRPFRTLAARRALLRDLNRLLPKDLRFAPSKADRRPTFSLTQFSSAEKLEGFKKMILSIISALREADADPGL